ncbi:hypothetical protein C8T65DRAFT_161673 [Cerioporus squamosus]|nr:hypothetical protein C8T65DRAFT_161673 [Cerioporus squamosus]
MATAKVLQLPTDIICSLFDQLRDDTQSLATCSLVCKIWEPASRSVLFHSLSVDDFKASYTAFDDFLGAAAHLADYIVDLRLVGRTGLELLGSSFSVVYCSALDVSLLARILSKLPSLRRLHLINLAYEGVLAPLPLPRCQVRRPSLDFLVFQNVPPISHEDSTLPELLNVIALFSYIGHLALTGDNAEVEHAADEDVMLDYEIPAQVDIRSLELKHLSSKVLAVVSRAIGETAPLNRSFESLTVCIHDTYGCVPVIGDFLRCFRHSVRHLRFDPMVLAIRSDTEYDEWDKLRLSECPNLTTLTLALKLPSITSRAYDARERCFRAYKLIISGALPSSLEQTILRLGAAKSDSSLCSLEWADMDRVLCRIPSLKAFVIDLCFPPPSCIISAGGRYVSVESFAP